MKPKTRQYTPRFSFAVPPDEVFKVELPDADPNRPVRKDTIDRDRKKNQRREELEDSQYWQ
jgi:hypothetical protein